MSVRKLILGVSQAGKQIVCVKRPVWEFMLLVEKRESSRTEAKSFWGKKGYIFSVLQGVGLWTGLPAPAHSSHFVQASFCKAGAAQSSPWRQLSGVCWALGAGRDLAWVRGGRHFQLFCSGRCNTSPHHDFLQVAVLSLLWNSPPSLGANVLGSILSSPQVQEGSKSTSVLLFVLWP